MKILIVAPTLRPDGARATINRGQQFDGIVDNKFVVLRSTQPLLDAARALFDDGTDPNAVIVMRHAGSDVDALRSTIGIAAGLTVTESDSKPTFRKWAPSPLFPGNGEVIMMN